jgi:hypothetical protein
VASSHELHVSGSSARTSGTAFAAAAAAIQAYTVVCGHLVIPASAHRKRRRTVHVNNTCTERIARSLNDIFMWRGSIFDTNFRYGLYMWPTGVRGGIHTEQCVPTVVQWT